MTKHIFVVAVLFAVCGSILSGCSKENTSGETATYGSFQLVADEALKPVVDSLLQGYMIENPETHITVKYVSATEAVRELLNHNARAILIDRRLTPTEIQAAKSDSSEVPVYRLAEDGIGCIVSAKNSATSIRKSDLAKMFAGTPSSWGDVTLVLPQYPSSIEYVMDSIVNGASEPKAKYLLRFSTTDSIISYVREHPKAIGFIGSAWYHTLEAKNDTSVKALPVIPSDTSSKGLIEPVLLHMAYIAEALYPLVTRVSGYSFEVPNTVPRGFLAYASTSHGQLVFKNFDVLPITQPIKLVKSK
ncbi:MAG TPA: substrate-binding domain-containing protein [Candidatus Kapabacteria bacterium]|jgi:phosphate transport system substrate-binding protein